MFKRVALENWHEVVPYIGFGLIAASFVAIVIWALRMKQMDVDHAAHLPLLDDEEIQRENSSDSQD